jgi:hypothetical protein
MGCANCSSITLFKGEDGKTIYNGNGAPTILTANEGDFYIDTTSWEIYGPFTGGSWGAGTSLIGPTGPTGATGNGIATIAWTSNSGGQPQGTAGTTDTYTITYTDTTTDTFLVTNGIDGVDSNSSIGKSIFVDVIMGSDVTGDRERFDLPFATYSAARAASLSGDTIFLRPGTHIGSIVLKSGVNIELAEGAIVQGVITDSGSLVVCNIGGFGSIINPAGKGISISGNGSTVNANFEKISSTDVNIEVRPGAGNRADVTVTAKSLVGTTINYVVTAGGGANVSVTVFDKIETAATFDGTVFEHRQSFEGTFIINCPKILIGNSVEPLAGQLYADFESTADARIYLNLGIVESEYNFVPASEEYGVITRNGEGEVRIKAQSIHTISRPGIVLRNTPGGKTFFEGNLTCENLYCVNNSSAGKLIIKNSTLHRKDGGADDNLVLWLGNSGIVGSVGNGIYTELRNVNIVKTSQASDTGVMVLQSGGNSKSFFFDVNNIIIKHSIAVDFNGAGVGEGDMYFKNVHSNATALGANVIQLEAPSNGYDGGQTNLETEDFE